MLRLAQIVEFLAARASIQKRQHERIIARDAKIVLAQFVPMPKSKNQQEDASKLIVDRLVFT